MWFNITEIGEQQAGIRINQVRINRGPPVSFSTHAPYLNTFCQQTSVLSIKRRLTLNRLHFPSFVHPATTDGPRLIRNFNSKQENFGLNSFELNGVDYRDRQTNFCPLRIKCVFKLQLFLLYWNPVNVNPQLIRRHQNFFRLSL